MAQHSRKPPKEPPEDQQEQKPWADMTRDDRTKYLQSHRGYISFVFKPYEEPRREAFGPSLRATRIGGHFQGLVVVDGQPGIEIELDDDDAAKLSRNVKTQFKWDDLDDVRWGPGDSD